MLGRNRRRKPDHMRGASSMVKKVRMAMVTMATSVDTAAAPTENAVAGLSTLVMLDVILDDPSREVLLEVEAEHEPAQRPAPLLGLRDEGGDLVAEVHRGRHERLGEQVDQADQRQSTDQEHGQGGPAVRHPLPLQETRRRRHEQREEEGDDDVDHDGAQGPEPEDEGDVEVDQRDHDDDRHDDGAQRDPPAVGAAGKLGPPRVGSLCGHGTSLAALTSEEAVSPAADVQA